MVLQRILVSIFILVLACSCTKEKVYSQGTFQTKINGASFVASGLAIDDSHISPILETKSNWVCLMPFALGYWDSTALRYNEAGQWYGETEKGISEAISLTEAKGLKVMIKPQIWFWDGKYTGHFKLNNSQDWQEFEKNYEEFILLFARVSETNKAPLFCIGTELAAFIEQRPEFWNNLIQKVRTVYSGEIVYAANWDNFEKIPFWTQLDYIGVDAYFPVSQEITPSVTECLKGWEEPKVKMKALSKSANKPILFTEFGYSSIDYCGKEPWNPDQSGSVNMQAQVNAYEALFQSFWSEDWFAGGFFWKWFDNHS
ncbi:MAG: glycoside hydrolase family 113, partial [Salibacteraceae bacterium]